MSSSWRFFDKDNFHVHVKPGRPCIFSDHEATLTADTSFRYSDTHACVECVRELTKPGLSIDINRIRPEVVSHVLRFWSLVDIRGPEDCWHWHNPDDPAARCFCAYQPWLGTVRLTSPSRAAIWYGWGDVGLLPYRRICDTRHCCNPLHLRVDHVPHFVYHRRIDHINLQRDIRKANAHRLAFTRTILDADPETVRAMKKVNPHWIERVARGSLRELESHDET